MVENGFAEFDLAGSALSMDGVAEIVDVTRPQHGELTRNGEGVWIYAPEEGFSGEDRFSYSVKSSTGHIEENTIRALVY